MLSGRFSSIALSAAAFFGRRCFAQTSVPYTEPKTGIEFPVYDDGEGYRFGFIIPASALKTDEYDYIGYLSCTTPSGPKAAWCGLSHGQSGQMTQSLLLVAWPYESQVLTSLRYATGYQAPFVYTGDATAVTLASSVTDTGFEIVYHCKKCFTWNHEGATGNVSTSSGFMMLGRAASNEAPGNAGCPDNIILREHTRASGQYRVVLSNAAAASYDSYAALPPIAKTPAPNCPASNGGNNTSSPPSAPATSPPIAPASTPRRCLPIPSQKTYDYVILGAGAGGIPVADRLSEAGHSVLLIEKGPPSAGSWGGNMGPAWLNGTSLTRFDVPGLCNQIWVDSTGVACTDTDQMAGCVLGGGTAVNAGLWWKPHPLDWNMNFPRGWKSCQMTAATKAVFNRLPGTQVSSMDKKLYLPQGFDMLASGLAASGTWTRLESPNDAASKKNHTYGHTVFMFSGGERGGPTSTYLKTAAARSNFKLWMNTAANRIVRNGPDATGVEVSCMADGGYSGTVNLTLGTGRVIVSAGTFGTAKILLRSGIGPTDQLKVVQGSSDGPRMIDSRQWINLPVGFNLVEQMNTDVVVGHPSVKFYDFYAAWDKPIAADKEAYLKNRTGILAQAAPNIGPMMWDIITVSDGTTRQLQWTSRVEGVDPSAPHATDVMTISQYLGRGQVSRGRATISSDLTMTVSTQPFFHNDGDREAVIQGIKNLQAGLSSIKGLRWIQPNASQTVEQYVDSIPVTANGRRANHWMGTAKMGTDDGRKNGTAVVDTNTKVYGTNNIFVVDASMFPGELTGNPSAAIMIASEHAAKKILAL